MERIEQMERASSPQGSDESVWLASRLLRRQVVNVSAVEPVGHVVDLIFDPKACRVMGVEIQSSTRTRGVFRRTRATATVGLDHVISMDGDVVMINADPFEVSTPPEFAKLARLNVVVEMAILTMRGTSLGTLADLLLGHRGVTVTGFVVSPTEAGELALPPLDAYVPVSDAGEESIEPDTNVALPARMRVIPASSNVHVGESLILLVGDVELQQGEIVVITDPTDDLY